MGDGRLGNVWGRGIEVNSSVFISKLASFPDPCLAGWVSGNEAVLKQRERDYNLPELGRKPVWSPLSKWAAAVQERSRTTVHHLDPNTITIHISQI